MAISSAALNGTDSSAKYQSVYLEFWQKSQSVAENKTTFGYKAYLKSNVSGASGYTGYGHYTFSGATTITKVTGKTWTWNYVTSASIAQGEFTIPHNANGTLANQTLTITAGGATSLGYATVSVTLPVATIPRATQPTVNYSSRDMGLAISIGVSGVATFSHNLYYSFTGIAKTFITTVTAGTTSYSWVIPLDGVNGLAPKIPNATSGTVTITAETLSGSTVIGSKTVTFTATVPASAIPTIGTKTAKEAVAGLDAKFGAHIQGKSKLLLEMASSGVYGSEITSQLITANGQTFSAYNGTKFTGTTGFLNTVGANTITYKATDSRGRSATATLSVTVLAYAAPQISVFKVERVNASGVPDVTGTKVKATYAITVAPLGVDKNTKAYTLKYKTSAAPAYTSLSLDADSYTPNTSTIPDVTFSFSDIYNFQLVATDYFGSTTVTGTVNSGFVPAHFRAGGKGIGIGMRATKDALQIGLPTEFSQEPTINGIPLLEGLTALRNQVPAAIGLTTVIEKNQYYPVVEDNTGMIVGRRLLNVWSVFDGSWWEAHSFGFGESALENSTGDSANGFGYYALSNNTGNLANGFGYNALQNNTGGAANGFGYNALQNNTGVAANGFGYNALSANTGNFSNGFGEFAVCENTGDHANGFGNSALFYNTGLFNSAFGDCANCVYDPTINALENTTCLGANTVPNRSNQVVLGDTLVDTIKMGGTARTPVSGTAGVKGETCWDTNYFYICVATNTWKRIPLQAL